MQERKKKKKNYKKTASSSRNCILCFAMTLRFSTQTMNLKIKNKRRIGLPCQCIADRWFFVGFCSSSPSTSFTASYRTRCPFKMHSLLSSLFLPRCSAASSPISHHIRLGFNRFFSARRPLNIYVTVVWLLTVGDAWNANARNVCICNSQLIIVWYARSLI